MAQGHLTKCSKTIQFSCKTLIIQYRELMKNGQFLKQTPTYH